jgi:hypothetical protein
MAPFASLPPELSFAILAKLNPLSTKKLRAASTEAKAAAAQSITSLAWTDQRPPRVRDLGASFPAAVSLKLHTEWGSEEDGVRWLRANQQLLARLHTLDLDLKVKAGSSRSSRNRLHEAVVSAAARCTALRSLSLDPVYSDALYSDKRQHRQLAALTNLTSLHLVGYGPYRELVETLRQLPHLQQLGLDDLQEGDLAATSRLSSLTRLRLSFTPYSQRGLGALAAVTGLRDLGVDIEFGAERDVEGMAQLTQLSSLSFSTQDPLDPTPLSTLTRLTHLNWFIHGLDDDATAAMAGVLRNLASLQCGELGGGRADPELLHSMSCTSLHLRRLVMDCSRLPPDRPPLPRLQSLQLLDSLSSCPLVLHLSGLTSLSLDWSKTRFLSDRDCSQLAKRLPLLRALHLGSYIKLTPSAPQPLTLDGLKQLGRLRHLQQLFLEPKELPLLAYPVLVRQCSALRRLLLDCSSEESKLAGSRLEACLASLAATQLRHVVLLIQPGYGLRDAGEKRAAKDRLQEVCDRVVGAWGRQELVMEARVWRSEHAWKYMMEQASVCVA